MKIPNTPAACYYCVLTNKIEKCSEVEEIIKTSPEYACLYACDILKARWPEAEATIVEDPKHAYLYAVEILKSPFPKNLHNIILANAIKDPQNLYLRNYFNCVETNNYIYWF